jgi:DNA-binding response OmpR family regulator
MLMENNSIIDSVKTKLSGASGYIQRPFLVNEMVQSIRNRLAKTPFQSSRSLAPN